MTSLKRILLVEDDFDIRNTLNEFLIDEGYDTKCATNGKEALGLIKANEPKFDVILSDIRMPNLDGQTLLRKIREFDDNVPIILMTAFGSIQLAVDAIKNGAHDFLTKPVDINDLSETLKKAFEYSQILNAKRQEEKIEASVGPSNLIAESPKMKKIFELVKRISIVDTTVLILGESGVGKEVVAHEIHNASPRNSNNFVAINCAAIPHELLESELFGHVKGSFTGAIAQKKGLFEEADGGTLFLDEIGDMDPALQAKVLRVIQERKIRPVGSTITKEINVRIIAATHRDLRSAIIEGKFREDLFYRLSVIPLVIVPLRERIEDIAPLAEHFVKRSMRNSDGGFKTFTQEALVKLQTYLWPGNVRELENAVERCVVMSPNNKITAEDLHFLDQNSNEQNLASEGEITPNSLCLKDIEKEAVILALKQTAGKKAAAAKLLGIDRKTLHRKELEYGLNEH